MPWSPKPKVKNRSCCWTTSSTNSTPGGSNRLIRLVGDDGFGQIFITDCNPTRLRTILDKTGDDYSLFTVENGGIVR